MSCGRERPLLDSMRWLDRIDDPFIFGRVPQSLASVLIHLIFSTKNREPWLIDSIRDELHAYIGGVVASLGGAVLKTGSVADHIHFLISQPRTTAPADLVREIKISSTKWLKQQDKRFTGFQWQAGYGMFSVSPSHRKVLEAYIEGQAEHHKKTSFQDEFRTILSKYGVEWDERYVWD